MPHKCNIQDTPRSFPSTTRLAYPSAPGHFWLSATVTLWTQWKLDHHLSGTSAETKQSNAASVYRSSSLSIVKHRNRIRHAPLRDLRFGELPEDSGILSWLDNSRFLFSTEIRASNSRRWKHRSELPFAFYGSADTVPSKTMCPTALQHLLISAGSPETFRCLSRSLDH